MRKITSIGSAAPAAPARPARRSTIVAPMDKKHVAEIEKLIARPIPWLDGTGFDSLIATNAEDAELPDGETVADKALPPRLSRGPRGRRNASDREAARPAPENHRQESLRKPPRGPASPGPQRRQAYSDAGEDRPVVGMGDHTPMFLLRPVKLKPAKMVEEQD